MATEDTNQSGYNTTYSQMQFGEVRWNGVVWKRYQVDEYNHRMRIIERGDRNGMNMIHEIDALYQLKSQYDNESSDEHTSPEL